MSGGRTTDTIMPSGAASVAELVLVFWLFALVMLAVGAFASHQRRLADGQRDLVRFQEAARTAAVILGGELRWLAPADGGLAGPGSMALRAVRGGGPVCGVDGSRLSVRYQGIRRPNPAKDSVLLVHARSEAVLAVRGVEEVGGGGGGAGASHEVGCGEAGLRLTLHGEPPATGGLALVFEPGSYHAVDGALRYRQGGGGRQPLTETVFADGAFLPHPDGSGVVLELPLRRDSLPRAPRAVELAIPMLNPGTGGAE